MVNIQKLGSRNICLVFWKSEPQYAYKRYAYKKKHVNALGTLQMRFKAPVWAILKLLILAEAFELVQ